MLGFFYQTYFGLFVIKFMAETVIWEKNPSLEKIARLNSLRKKTNPPSL